MIIVIYYKVHSKQDHQEKINHTLCSGKADLPGICAELLRGTKPFGWLQGKEHKHTDESSVLSCLLRSSLSSCWIKRAEKAGLDKSPWSELTHGQSGCSRTIFSGIVALCLWALKIPSSRTGIASLLMGMQPTSAHNSG